MIVCPLCEHQQVQGNVCDGCGKELAPPAPIPDSSAVMPELESTSIASAGAVAPAEPMVELANHRVDAVVVPAEKMPDLELTGFASAPAAAAEAIPELELERTLFADDGVRTPAPKVLVCRYCGAQQPVEKGVLCDGCGNRLPVYANAARKAEVELTLNCPSCGVIGQPGRRCRSCGAFVKSPEVS